MHFEEVHADLFGGESFAETYEIVRAVLPDLRVEVALHAMCANELACTHVHIASREVTEETRVALRTLLLCHR